MKRFPIYLDYDHTTDPVGFVDLDETKIPVDPFADVVIAPMVIVKDRSKDNHTLKDFGMFQRTNLDTRPLEERGLT